MMDHVIGLISANYSTPALGALTAERTVASLPFGGRYRLIDFALSNMVNSGIRTVGLITPYQYRSIIDHVGSGSDWSLDRKNGGLFILPGSVFGVSSSTARFLLRDLARNSVYLIRSPAAYVLATNASTVCSMDYRALVRSHIESGADITVACRRAEEDDPNATAICMKDGRMSGVVKGVKAGQDASLHCFLISRTLLLKIVRWYAAVDYLDFFQALAEDYGKLNIHLYRFGGYARGIFTVRDYFHRSMDLLNMRVSDELFPDNAPVMTKVRDTAPARYLRGASVRNALIPAGCLIAGTVENSVLFRDVTVEPGAAVRNSILLQSCVVESGACVENAIIDRNNTIPAGTVIKGTDTEPFVIEKNSVHREENKA